MSDPVDMDGLAAEARAALEACREFSPAPWTLDEFSGVINDGDGLGVGLVSFSDVEEKLVIVARNILEPLLNDRDRLKAEVATLEGILSDLASESYQVQRIRELEARVKVLEDALRPFAAWSRILMTGDGDMIHDDTPLSITGWIHLYDRPCFGDLRRAAKVMEDHTDGH